MDISRLRLALISGNYNMVRDGPTQALNRLVGYMLDHGAAVRVFAPTVENPQVEAVGEVISIPSFAIPGRSEYRIPIGLVGEAKREFEAFCPNIVHVASPDRASRQGAKWARDHGVPVLASVHTRFETYPQYYHLGFMEPVVEAWLRKLYRRCDALVAPSDGMVEVLHRQRMHREIGIWSRGVDRTIFNSTARDLEWRRSLGFADDEIAIGFLGRVVMEKGLPEFAETMNELTKRGVKHKVLVLGDGPARSWFAEKVPEAAFGGYLMGADLGRAVAGMDIFFNPSITETFGNVTLEAMACGVPVVAARATGATTLVRDGVTGQLVTPGDIPAYADAIAAYIDDPALRQKHGEAGEARSKEFSWEAINRSMAETYLRLVERRGGA
ncbi:glycosyltransferase [Porphyrobacter algicida]|uniref:Glycosyltransferase n=1 Tax=Qipengyuania algicida TaxID=1836209 RepID=A0A845ADB0_9SPHN|nr:glycosyltransferase family 1 protein [Qipengyuania algicida]MXP27467.1 glycosyltransferase [Qipengyuania algicida]